MSLAGASRVVLVGDLFTKGPDPAGVYRLVRAQGFDTVLGNHDQRLLDALAGKRPKDDEAKRCIRALDAEDRRWHKWLAKQPLFEQARPFTVVHAGLHPSGSRKKTTRAMALSMRRWPKEHVSCSPWHLVYQGERRIICGHDARRGLLRVERNGDPWIVGIDTGCVYGGKLTGYLVHTDRILQVDARRVYTPIT